MSVVGDYLSIKIPYYLFFGLSCCVFAFCIRKERTEKTIVQGLLLAYGIQVIYFAFLSTTLYLAFDEQARESLIAIFGSHPVLFKNLLPLTSLVDQMRGVYDDSSIMLNIFFTVPFGMYVMYKQLRQQKSKKWRPVLLATLALSVFIESCQLLSNFLLHYRYRIVTIDDVIMNVIGGFVGAAIVASGAYFWRKSQQRKRRTG